MYTWSSAICQAQCDHKLLERHSKTELAKWSHHLESGILVNAQVPAQTDWNK